MSHECDLPELRHYIESGRYWKCSVCNQSWICVRFEDYGRLFIEWRRCPSK